MEGCEHHCRAGPRTRAPSPGELLVGLSSSLVAQHPRALRGPLLDPERGLQERSCLQSPVGQLTVKLPFRIVIFFIRKGTMEF